MKKIYFGIITLAVIFLITACSKEEPQQQNEEVLVEFSLEIAKASSTQVYSDGTGADQLMYAVFSEDGSRIFVKKTIENNIPNLIAGHTVDMTLTKGHTYKAVFWAQNSNCTYYTVSDDMNVTVNYEGLNNDETRDAFFAVSEPFNVDNPISKNIILKRPFSQINVGAYESDYAYAIEKNLNITISSATIEDVPSKINLFDGTVSESVNVTYDFSAIPSGNNELLYVDVDKNGENEYYKYLSMCYVLSDTVGTTHKMAFNFMDVEKNKNIGFSEGLEFVPAKRNWRTNVVGQILIGAANFNVIIDPNYADDTDVLN